VPRDNAAHKAQRKGYLAAAPDVAFVRLLKAGHHVDQRGLACPVRRKNAHGAPKLHTERHAIKDHLALGSGPKGLADIFEL